MILIMMTITTIIITAIAILLTIPMAVIHRAMIMVIVHHLAMVTVAVVQ